MKKLYVVTLAMLWLAGNLMAQNHRNCGTMEYLEVQKASDPGLETRMESLEREIQNWLDANPNHKMGAVVTIPVVFHIVWNTSAQNISDARILAQLDVLNKDFARLNADAGNTPSVFQGVAANTNIQFCLAQRDPGGNATTGIIRKQTTVTSFSSNDNVKRSANGGSDAWPRDSYLNFWSCNLSGGLLGYAQFPGGTASTDGVVCLFSSIGGPSAPGTATPYHLGRTATHEVGHWLNLRHIWGDATCGNDQVADTPTQQTSNSGCPAFPKVTCSNGPNGDMFMNYMDYTYDACMNMFTQGQASRMNASLNTTRVSLLSSQGCNPPSGGGTCATPAGLTASSITSSSANLSWGAVSGATSYNVRYKPTASSTWTNTTSATSSKSVTGLTSSTNYEYQVQAVCSTTGAYSGSYTFTTSSASCSDPYEPNNSSSAYKTISTNTDIFALISSSSDYDWFRFSTTSPNTNVQVTLQNLPADYDVRLYSSSLSTLATGQNGGTTSESIKRNTSSAATYYIRVWGYNGAYNTTQCYKLRVNTSSTAFRMDENHVLAKSGIETAVFAVPNPASGQTALEYLSDIPGISKVRLMDMMGRNIFTTDHETIEGINKIDVDVSQFSSGLYLIHIEQGGTIRTGKLIVE
jgi:hypothetical protein